MSLILNEELEEVHGKSEETQGQFTGRNFGKVLLKKYSYCEKFRHIFSKHVTRRHFVNSSKYRMSSPMP